VKNERGRKSVTGVSSGRGFMKIRDEVSASALGFMIAPGKVVRADLSRGPFDTLDCFPARVRGLPAGSFVPL